MFSAADRSPSENRLPARTTSGGSFLQGGDALGCGRRISFVSRHAIQAFEHDPARRQRRVDVHRSQKGIDRARRIAQGHVAVTALLVEEAEPRMLLLQALQGCQRFVYPVQASLVGGDQVQGVAILGAAAASSSAAASASQCRPPLLRSRMRLTSSSIGEDAEGLCIVPAHHTGAALNLVTQLHTIHRQFIVASSARHSTP